MFCIVSLRCSSEGPSLRRDPAKAVGRLPQLPPLGGGLPLRPGVGRAAALARQHGPEPRGVAGGNRTDLGDQSGGGIGAFESTNTGTHSRTIVLAGDSEQTGARYSDHAAQHRPTCLLFPGRARARRRKAMSSGIENEAAIGFPGAAWHCPGFDSGRPGPAALREVAMKVFVAELPERSAGAAGIDRYDYGIHADDGFPSHRARSRPRMMAVRTAMI